MIARLQQRQHEFQQVTDMFLADGQSMWIAPNGRTWPEDLSSTRGIDPGRVEDYRRRLAQLGVSGATSDGESFVAFQHAIPACPICPVKSYVYTSRLPETMTATRTEAYTFAPDEFRRVCRPVEGQWYICLDHED